MFWCRLEIEATCSFFRIYIIKVVHQQVLICYCSYLVKNSVLLLF
nr:MAG TPA: hypothetical protein [Caudoviricetes sp.]